MAYIKNIFYKIIYINYTKIYKKTLLLRNLKIFWPRIILFISILLIKKQGHNEKNKYIDK